MDQISQNLATLIERLADDDKMFLETLLETLIIKRPIQGLSWTDSIVVYVLKSAPLRTFSHDQLSVFLSKDRANPISREAVRDKVRRVRNRDEKYRRHIRNVYGVGYYWDPVGEEE